MTEKQIEQIYAQLSPGEVINRIYHAFEGDIRVITRSNGGTQEKRYTVVFEEDGKVSIKEM